MTIKRSELLNKLKLVMAGVDTNATGLVGADTFVFDERGIHTFNDAISVSVAYETGITGAVKSRQFFNLISKLTTELIDVMVGDSIQVKSGRTKAKINFVESDVSDFIANIGAGEDTAWMDIPKGFIEALSLCKINCSNSALRGIYVRGNKVVSTDEMRINIYELDTKIPKRFWIDDPAVTELLKLNKLKHMAVTEGWVHFKNEDGVVFSAKRKDDEQYPFKTIIGWNEYRTGCRRSR